MSWTVNVRVQESDVAVGVPESVSPLRVSHAGRLAGVFSVNVYEPVPPLIVPGSASSNASSI